MKKRYIDKKDEKTKLKMEILINKITRFLLYFTTSVAFTVLCTEKIAFAYIGPGAGFAFVSSFFILFITMLLAFITIITWPIRAAIISIKNRKTRAKSKVKRIIVIGLDGLDPELVQKYIAQGNLPNFHNLMKIGCFKKLRTTTPSISPVAWSTFSTGVNPGKHNIFDFYTRDPKNYLPVLSSADISTSLKKINIGPFKIPYKKTQIKFLRKSISFWKLLGEHGIFSSIIRVPITFPPEKFYGTCLSAMCTPDLIGTQGTFTQFTSENLKTLEHATGGTKVHIIIEDNIFKTQITGPSIKKNNPLLIQVKGTVNHQKGIVDLAIGEKNITLLPKIYSDWIKIEFKINFFKKISGIVRFMVTELNPHLKIYMTPINIDPGKPSIPISHPYFFSVILSKLHGPFASLGLAEDTWALNERVIDESAFLKQSYDIYEDRKKQLMDSIIKNKRGLITTVFDTTDRIQHMFFRYLSDDHPANKNKDTTLHKDAIKELYKKMDELVADVQKKLNKDDLLIIISDHGFKSFKWGINLNSWLWKEGYITLKQGIDPGSEWLAAVDWTKTKAYAYGLAGIFLNVKGRERHGNVETGNERDILQNEIKIKLENLRYNKNQIKPIRRVLMAQNVFKGPYSNEAPDIFVGYNEGYRVSWNSALGKITSDIFEDNTKSWSGDHCIDPDLVPGIFFSNWKVTDEKPSIEDIAPTILNLFGLNPKKFHDGKVLNFKSMSGYVNEAK